MNDLRPELIRSKLSSAFTRPQRLPKSSVEVIHAKKTRSENEEVHDGFEKEGRADETDDHSEDKDRAEENREVDGYSRRS
jgi:hypothetical protein